MNQHYSHCSSVPDLATPGSEGLPTSVTATGLVFLIASAAIVLRLPKVERLVVSIRLLAKGFKVLMTILVRPSKEISTQDPEKGDQ